MCLSIRHPSDESVRNDWFFLKLTTLNALKRDPPFRNEPDSNKSNKHLNDSTNGSVIYAYHLIVY